MRTEVLPTADVACELDELARAVYGPPEERDDPFAPFDWAMPETSIVVRREGRHELLAHAGILSRTCLHNGDDVRVGGLLEVKTHPEVRGQRLGKAVVQRATALLRDDQTIDFGLLVCLEPLLKYYEPLGWVEFSGDLWVAQPDGPLRFNDVSRVMVLPARKPAPAGGVIDLCGRPW